MRPLLSNHAKYADAVTSNVRQNWGYHSGTPGLDMTRPWPRSKRPCAASAATTIQSDDLKPHTAAARKTKPPRDSRARAWVDSPKTANSAYKNVAFTDDVRERRQGSIAHRSFKRIETPADVVGTALFLASSDSDFITGQLLVVEGGGIMH